MNTHMNTHTCVYTQRQVLAFDVFVTFFKPPRAHYSFGNILPELGLDSDLTEEEGLRASPLLPLYKEGKEAPKGPFVFLLTFLFLPA